MTASAADQSRPPSRATAPAYTPPNPHDAEEALRPLLGRLYDAAEACRRSRDGGVQAPYADVVAQLKAATAVADLAVDLLGVPR